MHAQSLAPAQREPAYVKIRNLLQQAHSSLTHDPANAERCIAFAVRLLPHEVAPRTESASTPKSGLAPWQILRVRAFIETRLNERLSSADLAAVARLSPSHFARAFKRSFGDSPKAYVTLRKIARAKVLMLQGREPLTMVALTCGFADQAHFCRLFRRYEGQSPAAWRRLNTHAEPLPSFAECAGLPLEPRTFAGG